MFTGGSYCIGLSASEDSGDESATTSLSSTSLVSLGAETKEEIFNYFEAQNNP